MANVYYARGNYYIVNAYDTEIAASLKGVRVEGPEKDWVLSQAGNFVDCGGFAALEAWYY